MARRRLNRSVKKRVVKRRRKRVVKSGKPKVGMSMQVHGQKCTIYKVWPAGTVDVESPSGKCFRVTGLGFR